MPDGQGKHNQKTTHHLKESIKKKKKNHPKEQFLFSL